MEDAGTTAAPARSGATSLMSSTGRSSLVRAPRGTSLARTVLRAILASLRYHHHQEGTTTIITHQDEGAGGFQEPHAIACILGGAQAPASQRTFKQFAHEVNATLPRLEAMSPLRWSKYAITFSSVD